MHSSLAVHLRIDGPPLSFEHAVVVDRSTPVLDLLPIVQLHLGRTPDHSAMLQVGDTFYGPDLDEGADNLDLNPSDMPGIMDERARTSDPGQLSIGDLKNTARPVRLIISELDGWVFNVSIKPFDGPVPSQFRHPDFEQGFIPAPGTSTFQLANLKSPHPTPNRFRQLSQFRVAAAYEPEIIDVTWELTIATAMYERGLAVTSLTTLVHFVLGRPHLRVLHAISRDLAGGQRIKLGNQGYPPVSYVRGLVAQAPDLIEQSFLLRDPESIRRANEVPALPRIIQTGIDMGLLEVRDGELKLSERGDDLNHPAERRSEASARFAVDLAVFLAKESGVSFPTSSPNPPGASGLAEVIDFKDYQGS